MRLLEAPPVFSVERRWGRFSTIGEKTMRFTKMQAAGNDYVYMDALKAPIPSPEALARRISDRHFGVGRDVRQRHPLRRQVRLRQRAYG